MDRPAQPSPVMRRPPPASDAAPEPAMVRSPPAAPEAPRPQASPAADAESILGLNRGDRQVVTVLIVIALVLMAVHWYRLTQYRPEPIEVLHPGSYRFQLDVNRATWVEWMQLDRIGETLARRIVEDRKQRGPFGSVDDVGRVRGIGPKTLESLRPHLTCTPPTSIEPQTADVPP